MSEKHVYVYGDQVRINKGFFIGIQGHVIYDKGDAGLVVRMQVLDGEKLDEVFASDDLDFLAPKA